MVNTVPTTEYVLGLATKIEDVKSRLAQLQQEWDQMFNPGFDYSQQNRAPQGPTLMEKVLELLTQNPGNTYSAFDIAAQLRANRNSVGPLLSRLVAESRIEKRGHGTYGAVTVAPDFFSGAEESPDAA